MLFFLTPTTVLQRCSRHGESCRSPLSCVSIHNGPVMFEQSQTNRDLCLKAKKLLLQQTDELSIMLKGAMYTFCPYESECSCGNKQRQLVLLFA